jgi:hypothetical protein
MDHGKGLHISHIREYCQVDDEDGEDEDRQTNEWSNPQYMWE